MDIKACNKIGNSLIFEYIIYGKLRAGEFYEYVNKSEVKDFDDIYYL